MRWKEGKNGVAISKNTSEFVSEVTRDSPHKSAGGELVVGHSQEPPKGHPRALRSNSCRPGQFSAKAQSRLTQLCCYNLLWLRFLVASDNCVTR